MILKNKGNRKEQQKRRRQRLKHRPPKQKEEYLLIDGNWSYYPIAYCAYHKAYMTQGLVETHRCANRKCNKFRKVGNDEESQTIPS